MNDQQMSFFQHLEELRKRLIYILVSIVIGMIGIGIFYDEFIEIIFAPKSVEFISYQKFNELAKFLELPPFFGEEFNIPLQNRIVSGQMTLFFVILIVGGFIISVPFIIFQLWRFIYPALTKSEKMYSSIAIIATIILFLFGVLFSYYIIFPLSLYFFVFFTPFQVNNIWDLQSYISVFSQTLLGFGILFLLPIFVLVLSIMGLITARSMIQFRKVAFVLILVVAALITPNDPWTMLIAAIPLLLLYELSILVVKLTSKNRTTSIIKT